jgi:capsular polysaccharide transport system permease protein
MFFRSLRIQARVVGALVIRDLHVRYERDNLGFLWLVGEPMMFAWGVIALWRILNGSTYHSLPLVPLVVLGYMPLLVFRHMVNYSMRYIRNNSSLLYHRQVTLLDLFYSRVLMETAGNILAFSSTFFILYAFGQVKWPVNAPLLMLGYFYIVWWSAAMTSVIMPLSERSELVEKFWVPMTYLQVPLSGAYIMAEWVPAGQWRDLYLLMPTVHAYEMIRAGYFGDAVPALWSQSYIAMWNGCLMFYGLLLFRTTRKYIVFG